jgi:hypothetical protein
VTAAARPTEEPAEETAAEAAAARSADNHRHCPAAAAAAAWRGRRRQRHRRHRELFRHRADLGAVPLDELRARLAFQRDHAADLLDPARHRAAALRLDVLDRLGGLDVLDVLAVLGARNFLRRSFRDMHRAADGERAACRYGGQFRQGHSYRHGLISQLRRDMA